MYMRRCLIIMLQAMSKNRAAALAPFEQPDRDGVRPERPPPRAGRPPPRTVGGPMGAACHFNIMGMGAMGAADTIVDLWEALGRISSITSIAFFGPGS